MKFTKPGIPRCMIADLSVQETVQAVHVRSWFYKAVACLERNRQIRNTDNEQKINLFGRNVYRVDINIYREKTRPLLVRAVGGHRVPGGRCGPFGKLPHLKNDLLYCSLHRAAGWPVRLECIDPRHDSVRTQTHHDSSRPNGELAAFPFKLVSIEFLGSEG